MDYRGEVGVILINFGDDTFEVRTGDRIAQLVFNKIEQVNFEEVAQIQETNRGNGGFGSTGVREINTK